MDDSFKLVYRSPAAAKVTGWTNEEMLGAIATKISILTTKQLQQKR